MNKQRTLGIILQYVQMALNIIIMLVYTPIMLRILGKTEYGIYNVTNSTIAYLSLLSLGFGSSYIRYYSIYKKSAETDKIAKLNGLYLLVFFIIGAIALVAGLIFSFNAQIFYNESYTIEEINIAKVLMIFLSINMAISFPASVFTSYVTAQEKFIFQKILNMGKTVLAPAMNIVFLYAGFGSIGMVITTTIISIMIDFINIVFCFKKLKMKISFSKMEFKLLKDIFAFSIFIAINQVIDQINWQTDKIILGKMINGAAVTVYSIGASINTMFTSFSTAVSSVFSPKIYAIQNKEIEVREKNKEFTKLFIKVGRIQFMILALIFTGFIFFGKYFIYRWAGDGYDNSYYVALLLMGPAIIPLTQNIGIEVQRAKNEHKFRSIAYLIMAGINVGISILFVLTWGEVGAALGTAISILVANIFIMNIYYQKKTGIDIIQYWKNILKILPSFIPCIVLGICLMKFYQFKSFYDFISLICVYSLIYVLCIWFSALNQEEKYIIKKIFRKIFKKRG